MKTKFPCPVCGTDDWINGKSYVARRDQVNLESGRLQYGVLFDVWFPSQAEVTLLGIGCRRCGFIAYSPRPDEEDMAAKYQSRLRADALDSSPTPRASPRLGVYMDEQRALRGYLAATRSLGRSGGSVLDIGGADGKLLRPFIDKGFDCFVVDPFPSHINGVTRLGSTISDLSPTCRFDVILCNHFLEHIVDPLGVLKALTNHITAGGVLCVEVPDEVWGGLPLPHHAAVHVNYFTRRTAEILLKLSGWQPIWTKTGAGNYGEVAIAVTDIVARAEHSVPVSDAEYADAGRDSQMRLRADSELRREHFQVLASRVLLQAGSMLREGHIITNTRTVFDRAIQATKKGG
ncbi:MAG TPA: class I SAM-dependent methyltransferase [Streptosporangiaceae bacterium]|nr:class I SAM-dependent methyltransferase [Streptosporangiaceae bacterium]